MSPRFDARLSFLKQEQDFRCANCGRLVIAASMLSGVNNRNHCPYCLWSRHLDLHTAGDRLAACRSPMQPIGLALKRTFKKYGGLRDGELMLIHLCQEGDKVSINRIAADDNPDTILAVFEKSQRLDRANRLQLAVNGIHALGSGDVNIVKARLFGNILD